MSSVAGRYEQYKRGGQILEQWLIETASRHCNLNEIFPAGISRERTADRGLNTRALIRLAEIVASTRASTKRAVIPDTIIQTIDKVIQGRREFGQYYATIPGIKKSNDSHRHYINTLQQIHDILAPTQKSGNTTPKRAKSGGADKSEDINILNLFAQLQVEEPSQSPLGQTPSNRCVAKPKPLANKNDVEQGDTDENLFALWCFLADARDLRLSIVSTWLAYASGDVSFMAGSLVLETGLTLLRQQSLNQAYTKDWLQVPGLLGYQVESIEDTTYVFPLEARSSGGTEPLKMLSPGAAQDLLALRKAVLEYRYSDEELLLRRIGVCELSIGIYKGPLHSFRAFMMDRAPEIAFLMVETERGCCDCCGSIYRTELMKGLVQFCRTGLLPVWLVVAFETYCGIYEIIGSSPECPGESYISGIARVEASLTKYRELLEKKPLRPPKAGWTEPMDMAFARCQEDAKKLRWSKDDLVGDEGAIGTNAEPEGTPLRTIRGLPCVTGFLLYTCKFAFHAAVVRIGEDLQLLLSYAHLYCALRKYGLMKTVWHDMVCH